MNFEEYIAKCVVKILKPRHRISGTGFWVLPDGYCLTCFHVIADKGRIRSSIEIEYGGELLQAVFCPKLSNPDKDVVVLKVADESIQSVPYVPLGLAQTDTEVRSYGYRHGWTEGYIITGVLRPGQFLGKVGEVYNLETHMPDRSSVIGMSGAPVFDPRRGVVVGILYGEEEEGPATSYVHPIDKVYESWPELRTRNAIAATKLYEVEGVISSILDVGQRGRLLAKLRELENSASLALRQFQKSKLAIPYPEREADRDLRNMLINLPAFLSAFWIVIGDAGIGKTTLLLHLVEWCQVGNRYFPIWLDQDLFYENGEKLSQFFDCPPEELGFRLQQFADLAQKHLVLFVDALDVILPHADNAKLVSQLNKLASNSILICSSRPSEYKRLKEAGNLKDQAISLTRLSNEQVLDILRQAYGAYQVQVEDLDSALIEMCQNPFILYLLLESSKTEPSPYISNPTDTWVRERYWYNRVRRVRLQAFAPHRFGGMSGDEVGQAKANIAYKIANRMLETQTYRLNLQTLKEIIEEAPNRSLIMQAVYQELVAEGVLLEDPRLVDRIRVNFLHASFAEFVICKQILEAKHWQPKIGWLLKNIGSPFYVRIIVRLVWQAYDIGHHEIEDRIYYIMMKILEYKRRSQTLMNRAWGVTYALHQLAPIWVERMCATLREHCPQEAASSIASVLENVRHPMVIPTLVDEMNFYKFKKRFIDGLGTSGDPAALEPLLTLLEHLLSTRDDDELLETIAVALGKIGDERAQQWLMKLETDNTVPRAARRAAREALWLITNQDEYSEALPYTDEETIDELRIYDKKDPARYSDWKMVKRTAERIASEVKKGETLSATVIEALIKALDHEHEDAQRGVVQALEALATGSAINSLTVKVLDSQAPDAIRNEIVESLAQIATQSPPDSHIRWNIHNVLSRVIREDSNPQVRRTANNALRRIF